MNAAESIPYKNNKHKWWLVKHELNKGRYVEVWDKLKVIYSAEKWEKAC